MRLLLMLLLGLPLWVYGQYSAELKFFTVNGDSNGAKLLPSFYLASCWSGIGASSAGNIYIAVSNHDDQNIYGGGNVALFKYNPVQDTMTALSDIRSVSTAVNNWMANEHQMKVHSFIMENNDGKMYFSTDDYDRTFNRGAHLYYINQATDQIVDFSKTQPKVMKRNFSVIDNIGTMSDTSGVFVQYYGVKGIYLNPKAPDLLYAITYPEGHVIKYRFSDGTMQRIATAGAGVPYVMYVDNSGNLYYCSANGGAQDLKKYTVASGAITTVQSSFNTAAFSMAAPTASGDTVYFSCYDKNIFRLICPQDKLDFLIKYSGTIWGSPGLFNLTLTPDGRRLFVLAIDNNPYPWERLGMIDLTANPVTCNAKFDSTILSVVGGRNLCFGGVNVWDKLGNFYAPCWNGNEDIALLKVHTPYTAIGVQDNYAAGFRPVPVYAGAQLAPNPVVSGAYLELVTRADGKVNLALYNARGERAKLFYNEFKKRDRYFTFWDGRGDSGSPLAPGVYFCYLNGALAQKVFVR